MSSGGVLEQRVDENYNLHDEQPDDLIWTENPSRLGHLEQFLSKNHRDTIV